MTAPRARNVIAKIVFALAGATLLVAVAMPWMMRRPEKARVDLKAIVPASIEGWIARDLPLGNTELLTRAATDVLQFDSFVFREFRSGNGSFSIYAAHWAAGKTPIQTVASHSPDHCWVLAGWKCLSWSSEVPAGRVSRQLGRAESRVYQAPNAEKLNVRYWHLVNGKPVNYGYRYNVSNYGSRWFADGLWQLFHGNPEQVFIRLSSELPLDEIEANAGVQEVLASLLQASVTR